MRKALALALVVAIAPACHRRQAPHKDPARHHGQGAEEAGLTADNVAANNAGGAKYKEPVVYVDGEPRATFAYHALPANVRLVEHRGDDGAPAHHVLVCEWLGALGVDCGTVAMTHWYRGKAITMLSGDELRRQKATLYVGFAHDVAGPPRLELADGAQIVGDVAIYVKKPAPAWSDQLGALADDTGAAWDRVPYTHEDGLRGVRVTVDGVLAARIKRNLLDGNVTPVNDDAEAPRYRLRDFLAAQELKLPKLRGVDLVVRQERVLRLSAADAQDLQFVAARKQHGEMMFYFGQHAVPALAVDVWARVEPPARPMRAVSVAEVQGRR